MVVISKDNYLNKAHVKFLENSFYNLSKRASRSVIINNTVPTCSSVSEYDKAMLEEFIDNARLLVSTLRYKFFEPSVSKKNSKKNLFYIKAARGADATGSVVSDGKTLNDIENEQIDF